jgi:hypothetical protein
MGSRFFNVMIVLFWLATMSWLVVTKVLPPLRVGDPPNYGSILASRDRKMPVCWRIKLNHNDLGWSATRFTTRADGLVESRSQVYLDYLPLDQVAPGWIGTFIKPLVEQTRQSGVQVQSQVDIDPLGRLLGFRSKMTLANLQDSIRLQGTVNGTSLSVRVQSADFSYRTEKYLPANALVADELSPQAQLPGLRVGQQWTMPIYSPFRPPDSPLEILQATVEREASLVWNGESTPTRLVVYRGDPGASGASANDVRGRLWVRIDGLVLKQELNLLHSKLQFVRMSPREGRRLLRELGEDFEKDLPPGRGKEVFIQFKDNSQ